MEQISVTLHKYIEENIIPLYSYFDKAHQIDHAIKVIDESMLLAKHYEVNIEMVYVIAAYHDLGLKKGREFHHLFSGQIVENDLNLHKWFSTEQINIIKEAVEDHRASNKHIPRSIYGKIVAEADRIIEPITTLTRTVQYGLSHYVELNKESQYERFCNHLQEKYAYGGYLNLWIPESQNASRLKELREIIANKKLLRGMFDKIYSDEKGQVI